MTNVEIYCFCKVKTTCYRLKHMSDVSQPTRFQIIIFRIFRASVKISVTFFSNQGSIVNNPCTVAILLRIRYFIHATKTIKRIFVGNVPDATVILHYKIQSVCVCVCKYVCWSGIGSKTMRTTMMKLLQVTQ